MQTPGKSIPHATPNDNYILVINGKPEGPFSIAELRQRNIKPGDFVKTAAMIDYKEAHEIPALRELFGFERRPLPLQYFGSFDQRAIAAAIDWLLLFGSFVLIAFVVMMVLYIIVPGDDNKMLRVSIIVGVFALTPIAKFIYNIRMESGPKQGTYGKQLLRIRVCDIYGDPLTTSKALIRNVAKLASVATVFVGYFFCFFNTKQQCLHDMIADTLVIKDRLDS